MSPALLRSESAHPFLCGTLIAIGKRTKSQCNEMSVGTGGAGATLSRVERERRRTSSCWLSAILNTLRVVKKEKNEGRSRDAVE